MLTFPALPDIEGQILELYAKFTESDDNPDIAEATDTHVVTEDDIVNGFEIGLDLYVKDNGGVCSGQSVHFIVKLSLSPNR